MARIDHRVLVDAETIIPQLVRSDELAANIFRLGLEELELNTESLACVVEALEGVALGLLGLQVGDGAEGVLPLAVAGVGGSRGTLDLLFHNFHINGPAEFLALGGEVGAGARVRVVDEILSAHEVHCLTEGEVVEGVANVLVKAATGHGDERCGFTGGVDLGDLATTERDGEGVAAAINAVVLTDLDGVVSGPDEDGEGTALELGGEHIVHDSEETADFASVSRFALLAIALDTLANLVGLLASEGESVHRVRDFLGLGLLNHLLVVAAGEGVATSDVVDA